MKVLGLYDGHNCGAAIIDDGKILAAVEEERLSRIKLHDGRYNGMPYQSIDSVFRMTEIDKSDIDLIAIPLLPTHKLMARIWADVIRQRNWRWMFFFLKKFGNWGPLYFLSPLQYQRNRRKRLVAFLKETGLGYPPIKWIDHHTAHAASAYYTSGFDNALTITFDGQGDGLSGSAFKCQGEMMDMIDQTSSYHTIANVYSAVTVGLGFRPGRHEGKITGLAAFGDWSNPVYDVLKDCIDYDGKRIRSKVAESNFTMPYPWASAWDLWVIIQSRINQFKADRKEIAAAIQKRTEEIVVKYIEKLIEKTSIHNIALAGGLFSNVKINQRILENSNVNSVYIQPAMGDGGLVIGAALYAFAMEKGLEPHQLNDVYLGPEFTGNEIEEVLRRNDVLEYVKSKNIERETAEHIADNKVVGRFNGRMEYGPRALGNRSILYHAADPNVNDWLNKRLKRTEFMPFAPSALEESSDELYSSFENGKYPARFMTISFDVTDYGFEVAPAVTHVDNTARPQVVKREYNEAYYKILKYYEDITGIPCFVNTSFNMHEEPIVCTPEDAVRAFIASKIDYLSIGEYIVERKKV